MFPTEPIRQFINLSFAKASDELAKVYATEVSSLRLNYQPRSGRYFQAIMLAGVRHTKSRVTAWIRIVHEACREANRIVDREVTDYILTEVLLMCEAAKAHIAHSLAQTLSQSGMHMENLKQSLVNQADREISSIESEVRREIKLEELKENVRNISETANPPKATIPSIALPEAQKPNSTGWTRDQKIAVVAILCVVVIGLATLIVTVGVPEIRTRLRLDKTPNPTPQAKSPVLEPSDRPSVLVDAVLLADNEEIRVQFINRGRTPAFNLGTTARVVFTNVPDFENTALENQTLAEPTSSGNLAPNTRIVTKINTHNAENPRQFEMMKRGKLRCLVFGYARYVDLVGNIHEPRFCFRWSLKSNGFAACPTNSFTAAQKP